MIPEIVHLHPLIDQYDAFLIDQFGVLLDGSQAYPGATEALGLIATQKKPAIILSNSAKRSKNNCDRLVSLGFDRRHFITVVTSGEIACQSIAQEIGASIDTRARVMLLAREGDPSPIADLGLIETKNAAEADILLIASRDLSWSRDDYLAVFKEFRRDGGRCICLNPDLKMLTPQGLRFSAGAIAQIFEGLGGTIEWYGKPHSRIYKRALELMPEVRAERVLCIGDSIHHDILGGATAGLSTALVRSGVHADMLDKELLATCSELGVTPNHVLERFSTDI
ncbi:TIGR01459 family HAD-type hydrolase [uncultured Roseobacter sp.]|uniref:TIGR01459 family HAD-type hydrolase n=1 Tax=uncultured Roseobacter sp. TaxID=114847 RepID=UPI00261F3F24|nr:TIGR01459 family HAD-type hydrolase [uncultured Roseobacter sp.]